MKKREIIETDSTRHYADGNLWESFFENGGDIFSGIAKIVGSARTKTENVNIKNDATIRNIDEAHASFWQGNGTTITALIIGGVAVTIVLILCLKK